MADETRPEADAGEDVDDAADPATDASGSDGPGARLRAAREALGRDLESLAAELNLKPRVLRALEDEDFEALPGPTFVRGYLRACARSLDLPADALLADYADRIGRIEPTVKPSPRLETAGTDDWVVHRRPGLAMGAASALLVVLGVGAVWALWPDALDRTLANGGGEVADAPVPVDPAARTVVRAPAAATGLEADAGPDAARAAGPGPLDGPPGPEGRGGPAPTVATPRSSTDEPPGGPDAGIAERGAVPAAAADDEPVDLVDGAEDFASTDPEGSTDDGIADRARDGERIARVSNDDGRTRIFAGGEDHLQFRFSGECWVEVRDADDVTVYSDVKGDGEVVDLWGRAPFRLVVGYAPAVTLAYNDTTVPLGPHTRGDVANLVIGR